MSWMDWETFMKTIVWIARTTGFLSMIGTSYVIYEILSEKKKRQGVYFRLVCVMSFIEFCDGLAFFLGTWATPSDNFWWGSSGSHASCMFQSFLLQASIGSSLYNASLALYYLLSIRYNWSERLISQKIEPWMHGISLTIAYGTAIASYFLGIYGSIGSVCYIGRYPPECKETYRYGYTDCERGDNASLYSIIFFEIWQYSAMVFTAGCMCLVWSMVRNQENRVARYTQNFERTNFSTDTIAANRPSSYRGGGGNNGNNDQKNGIDRKYSKRFAIQGALYVLVFYLSHFFATLALMMYHATGQWPQPVMLLANIFIPFEGGLNTLVYMRPRLLRYWSERQKQKKSRLAASTFVQSVIDDSSNHHNNTGTGNTDDVDDDDNDNGDGDGDDNGTGNDRGRAVNLQREEKEQMRLDAY